MRPVDPADLTQDQVAALVRGLAVALGPAVVMSSDEAADEGGVTSRPANHGPTSGEPVDEPDETRRGDVA
jgi:hypothetical protein